jgi:UDP-N-acetylglucosamine:LPS N-acetylglucosamine transferase
MKFLLKGRGAILVHEEAKKAKTQARQAVLLLEQARTLLAEDNAMQLAMKHIDEAISEAERRAAMLEDWYRRTYSSADSGPPKPGI